MTNQSLKQPVGATALARLRAVGESMAERVLTPWLPRQRPSYARRRHGKVGVQTATALRQAALKGVLIIVENLPVPFDRRVWNEATTLVRAGYDVAVICPVGHGAEKRYELLNGVHIYRHPLPEAQGIYGYMLEYPIAFFWQLILSARVFIKHRIDVVHACNPPDTIFLIGALYKYLFGCKFIFDHHDLCPELYVAKTGRRGFIWHLLVGLERLTFAVADVVISTNESYRRIAVERGSKDPDSVFVVRSGPDLNRIRPVLADPLLRRGHRYLVGYIGVIGPQEGLDYLLLAAKHIVYTRGRMDIGFMIIGGGPALARMKVLADALQLNSTVEFTGRISDNEVMRILSTADVCVGPDECNEMNDKSTMNKIMEYMALGKPIVQFDVTEGRYSAQEASLYARPNDPIDFAEKILELVDQPELRSRMGTLGLARVHGELAWKLQAPKLLAAYEAADRPRLAARTSEAKIARRS